MHDLGHPPTDHLEEKSYRGPQSSDDNHDRKNNGWENPRQGEIQVVVGCANRSD